MDFNISKIIDEDLAAAFPDDDFNFWFGFYINAYFGVGIAGVQLITPPRMRAQISALMLFSTNLFGLAFGPSAVALMTDFVFGDDLALRYALALLPAIVCPLAAGLAWQGMQDYRTSLLPLPPALEHPESGVRL